MANDNIDDWEDVAIDDWEDVDSDDEFVSADPVNPEPKENKITEGESWLRGHAQGGTSNWAGELSALANAAVDKVQASDAPAIVLPGGVPVSPAILRRLAGVKKRGDISWEDSYRTHKDAIDARDAEAKKQNPKAYTTGEVTGSINLAMAPGVRGIGGAIGNTTMGALDAAGRTEGETVSERARDVFTGGAMGFGFGAIGGLLGRGMNGVSKLAKEGAETQATNSLGPMLADEAAMAAKGTKKALGRELLDEGVTGFGTGPRKQAERLAPILEGKGQRIGAIRQSVDDQADELLKAGDMVGADSLRVDFDNRLAQLADNTDKAAVGGTSIERKIASHVGKEAENLSEVPLRSLNKTAEAIRKIDAQLPKGGRDFSDWTPKQRALYKVRKSLADQMDEKIKAATKDFDEYQTLKDQFGMLKGGQSMANTSAMKGKDSLLPGLRDSIIASGTSRGGADFLPKLMAAKVVLSSRGNAMAAKTLDGVYKTLSTNPEVMAKYASPLGQAIKKGHTAYIATHIALMNKDPEYAKLAESVTQETTPENPTQTETVSVAPTPETGDESVLGLLDDEDEKIKKSRRPIQMIGSN